MFLFTPTVTGVAKQNEATRQLKFVNEAILQMIADAENAHRMVWWLDYQLKGDLSPRRHLA